MQWQMETAVGAPVSVTLTLPQKQRPRLVTVAAVDPSSALSLVIFCEVVFARTVRATAREAGLLPPGTLTLRSLLLLLSMKSVLAEASNAFRAPAHIDLRSRRYVLCAEVTEDVRSRE